MKSKVEIYWDRLTEAYGLPSDWHDLPQELQYVVVKSINTIIHAIHVNRKDESNENT